MNTLEILEGWLSENYEQQLGISLVRVPTPQASAMWIHATSETPNCAHLFDVDLGVWFKFVVLDNTQSIRSDVDQVIQRSLSDSSQLLMRSGLPTHALDEHGAWTVSIVFLVQVDCKLSWEAALQDLRSESGFTEELSIDRVLLTTDSEFKAELASGRALPQLLFASRKVLSLPPEKMSSWMSADDEIRILLNRLEDDFPDTIERGLVKEMVAKVQLDYQNSPAVSLPSSPQRTRTVEIRNMRNVQDFTLHLQNPNVTKNVCVNIIHGPNGTGKSSLFEGLSFAVAGTSRKMAKYLADGDITRPTSDGYLRSVLTPLDSEALPIIKCDGKNIFENFQSDLKKAEANLASADGTLLAQEDAKNFVNLRSSELGLRVLTGYSGLAQNVQSHCEREYLAANSQRQDWLRKFGIIASITKADTRLTKLIDYFLLQDFPYGSQQINSWLNAVSLRVPSKSVEAKTLAVKWDAADGKAGRDDLTKRLVNFESLGANEICHQGIAKWIEQRNSTLLSIIDLSTQLSSILQAVASQRVEIAEDLKRWKDWLLRDQAQGQDESATAANASQLAELSITLEKLKALGTSYSEQQQHLLQVQKAVLPTWSELHPDTCPTSMQITKTLVASLWLLPN